MTTYAKITDVRKRGLEGASPTDPEIEAAIALASELIDSWCGQDFDLHEDSEIILDGNDGDRLITTKKIVSISELKIDESVIPSESITVYPNDMIGEIALKDGYCFLRGIGNIIITADIGWSDIPLAITEACAHLAAMILNRQIFSGRPELPELASERLLDYARIRVKPSEIKGIIESDTYLFGLLRPYRLKGVLS